MPLNRNVLLTKFLRHCLRDGGLLDEGDFRAGLQYLGLLDEDELMPEEPGHVNSDMFS